MSGYLSVESLHVTYPGRPAIQALRGVDLELRGGQVTALLGRNGAGKSTLVSAIVGLVEITSGRIALDDVDLTGPGGAAARSRIGYVPQEEALYPMLSGWENFRIFGRLAGLARGALTQRMEEVAESLLIADLMDRPARDLSGGERRRLHNGIALLGSPDVVLLDEPTVGVDPPTREALLGVVRRLANDGTAVAYATHYLTELEQLDARIVVLDRGRVVAAGTHDELVRAHGTSRIDVSFEGAAPSTHDWMMGGAVIRTVDDHLSIVVDRPETRVGEVLDLLGEDRRRVRRLDVIDADLDAVFQTLTGPDLESSESDATSRQPLQR